MPGRRGAAPTPFPAEYDEVLGGYAAALEAAPLSADTRRTYVSRVRQYLAWLHRDTSERRFGGDPLAVPGVRDWAVRDYRRHLLRDADPKRSVRYCNNALAALAALDDFYTRLGTGKADIACYDLPRAAPRALGANAQIRWLRAVRQWPHVRDRALALSPLYVDCASAMPSPWTWTTDRRTPRMAWRRPAACAVPQPPRRPSVQARCKRYLYRHRRESGP